METFYLFFFNSNFRYTYSFYYQIYYFLIKTITYEEYTYLPKCNIVAKNVGNHIQ